MGLSVGRMGFVFSTCNDVLLQVHHHSDAGVLHIDKQSLKAYMQPETSARLQVAITQP